MFDLSRRQKGPTITAKVNDLVVIGVVLIAVLLVAALVSRDNPFIDRSAGEEVEPVGSRGSSNVFSDQTPASSLEEVEVTLDQCWENGVTGGVIRNPNDIPVYVNITVEYDFGTHTEWGFRAVEVPANSASSYTIDHPPDSRLPMCNATYEYGPLGR